MFLFKPYLHLDQTSDGDYHLYIAVALHDGFKLGEPIVKVNSESLTREITLPLEEQHAQIYYAPVERLIKIDKNEKEASRETSIEVKVGSNTNPIQKLQHKGTQRFFIQRKCLQEGEVVKEDLIEMFGILTLDHNKFNTANL